LKELPHPRNLIDSPVYSSFGSQLGIRISPRIFEKFQMFPGRVYWDQEKLFEEKTGEEKFLDTVPLKSYLPARSSWVVT
jgi:hypothetical protein